MIKALKKLGIEEMYLNIIRSILDKSIANIILNGKKLKSFPLRSDTRQWCSLSNLLCDVVQEFLAGRARSDSSREGRSQIASIF
jgi:hypothetical protein